ncbi:CPBP family intramembrane metalloprotease [Salinibacterium sp. SYSU T00001]|uniref:CPBP family intramembrane glutamic endopeptidase n=1 Tax=Homoserinimonas sedimenticola TaxID=2986805 RepID=UPI002235D7AB|nr:type II CAAX endopeptidase family protein [Salinibacterium sedimenticola]MCW4386419.1 CPBP family intramembrane metalloprotease [Salinibacterium sedimenticola]
MLSPGHPLTPAVLGVVLGLVLVALVVRAVRKDRREYARFKRYRSTRRRQALYRRWLIDSFAVFGGASLVILALTWRQVALLLGEVEGWAPVQWFRDAASAPFTQGLLVGGAVVLAAASIAVLLLARGAEEVPTIGDISSLLPRNRSELRYGLLLSLNAGVVEELMFRLALPALVYGVTGSALAAVLGSVGVFAALHVYQGVAGILGSAVVGGILMALYLLTGSILVPILVHVFIDLRSLVFIPVMVFGVHRRSAAQRSSRASGRS